VTKGQVLTASPGGQPANSHSKVQIPRNNSAQISVSVVDVASNGSHTAEEKGKRLSLIIQIILNT